MDIFTLMVDAVKDYGKAKKAGEAAEESFRDFHQWLQGFLAFAACYLETRPGEYRNVIRYLFLMNELFLGNRGSQWRDYDEKFRRHQDGNTVIPFGLKKLRCGLRW